jgi:[protein-PII] uridylyltransferase
MTMRARVLAQLLASSQSNTSRAPLDDAMDMVAQPPRTGASPPNCSSGTTPIATIHQALRAIANESGPREGLNRVKLLRPLVAQAHDILREHFESGGSAEDYLRDRARLADSVVVGLLRIASISSGIRDRSAVAPIAAIAAGGYGRRELAPGSDLDVLFLLPESSSSHAGAVAPATRACVGAVVACLWDLGFVLDHAARTVQECLELAKDNAAVLAGLVDRRYLWGRFDLFAALDTDLAALFAGPDAGCWREAVSSALSATRRYAPREVQAFEDEPDVKRGPGGLRDLQRALWANTCAAGRSMSLKHSSLIQAHHFLWLVRCHLHFLAGRAEDRLSMSLQPSIARRIGLAESHESAAPLLLDLYRYHARNIVAAIESAPWSPVRLSNNR